MFIDRDRGRFYFIFKTLFRFKTCPRKGKVVRVDKIYTIRAAKYSLRDEIPPRGIFMQFRFSLLYYEKERRAYP